MVIVCVVIACVVIACVIEVYEVDGESNTRLLPLYAHLPIIPHYQEFVLNCHITARDKILRDFNMSQ